MNNLIRQKDKFCKADKIISESEIVSREAAGNTAKKTRQSGRAGEIYQNWETPGGTRRFDRSISHVFIVICSRRKPEQLKLDFINLPFFNHDNHESLKRVREVASIILFSWSISTWVCLKIMLMLSGYSKQCFSNIIDDLNK